MKASRRVTVERTDLGTMREERNTALKYTIYGVLFGLLFPILATLWDLSVRQLPLAPESVLQVQSDAPLHWIIDTIPLVLGVLAAVLGARQAQLARLRDRLTHRVHERDQAIHLLEVLRASLEEKVLERTSSLAQRARYLEATAEVARQTASMLNLHELLAQVVNLISEEFGFYHTGVFLIDASGDWAVLEAASSEGGWRMLARRHRLRVGIEGIVGYVTGRGDPRIALDVGSDAVYFDNPDLPETRSELALPLRVRGTVIGALDVQSQKPEAFRDEDITVLQILADQVAIAISNARLMAIAEEGLETERRAYGEMARRSWSRLFGDRTELRERYDPQGILSEGSAWRREMQQALQTGETVPEGRERPTRLAAPIKVRGQVVGVLDAQKPQDMDAWSQDEIALLETMADQLGVALESARLYQDTQLRAARERVIRDISDRLQRAPDMETLLQIATEELNRELGGSRSFVRLGLVNGADDGDGRGEQ